MGFKLCKNEDGLVKLVREELHAILIRVPQEIYKPLTVLVADKKNKLIPPVRGNFKNFLAETEKFSLRVEDLGPTRVANISGKETIEFDTNLGIKILEGYLKGFLGAVGISVPSFTLNISSSKTLSYTFQEVFRVGVDHGILGKALADRQLDLRNPAVKLFVGPDAVQMLLIDQIFVSKEFSITFQTEKESELKAELDAMVAEFGKVEAGLKVKRSSSNTVSFQGEKPLPFAFSCIKLILDEEGYVDRIPQAKIKQDGSRSDDRIKTHEDDIQLEHQLIEEELEMVEL